MIENLVPVCLGAFFGILGYALLRIIMFGKKKQYGGVIQSPSKYWYPVPTSPQPKLEDIPRKPRYEQPSKPWPIVIKNMPEYYVKEINNKIVIVMGEENAKATD